MSELILLLQRGHLHYYNPLLTKPLSETVIKDYQDVTQKLSDYNNDVLAFIQFAKPKRLKFNWWQKLLNRELEFKIRLELIKLKVYGDNGLTLANHLAYYINQYDRHIDYLNNDLTRIEHYLAVLTAFMASDEYSSIDDKARYERKADNLLLLKNMVSMNIAQAQMAIKASNALLDRHSEIDTAIRIYIDYLNNYDNGISDFSELNRNYNKIFGSK